MARTLGWAASCRSSSRQPSSQSAQSSGWTPTAAYTKGIPAGDLHRLPAGGQVAPRVYHQGHPLGGQTGEHLVPVGVELSWNHSGHGYRTASFSLLLWEAAARRAAAIAVWSGPFSPASSFRRARGGQLAQLLFLQLPGRPPCPPGSWAALRGTRCHRAGRIWRWCFRA